MWPSFLSRSLPPPLLSHLRRPTPARCVSFLRSSSQILSRAYTTTAAHGAPAAPGTWPHFCNGCVSDQLLQRRRHLYVVLDDWKEGFSLHRLGLDDLLAGGGDDAGLEPQRLPDPILRLSFRTVGTHPRFHALGSNIVVTNDSSSLGLTLVYHTETAALDVEHSLPRDLSSIYHAVAAGDKLYTFDSSNIDNGGLPYLCQTKPDHIPPGNFGNDDEEDLPYWLKPQRQWAWERHAAPPPFTSGNDRYVSTHALHPDGRTVFISFRNGGYSSEAGTFSLDTERGGEWTRRGDWCLPFSGDAQYDGDLGAWVGTRTVHNKKDGYGYDHLCTCDVPDMDITKDSATRAPAWTVAKKTLTFLEAPVKTLGQVLLPTGGGGVFFLVETAMRHGFTCKSFLRDADRCLLRVTMFRAKYGRKGELVAAPLWPGRSYLISRYVGHFHPYAFWI